MKKRIKSDSLPEFDAAPHLDSQTAIAAYLADIREAKDSSLLASALGDIARAQTLRGLMLPTQDPAGVPDTLSAPGRSKQVARPGHRRHSAESPP